jgi:Na+/melibiose symporter-like transporter
MTTVPAARARKRWWVTPTVMLVGGVALTLAATFGGGHFMRSALISGLVITVLATAGFVVIGRTRGDLGAIVASAPDERQQGIDLRATAASGVALAVILVVGSIVSLAQGHSGQPWVDLAAAYGVVYVILLAIFRRS